MLVRHARMAMDLGVAAENTFVMTNGDVLEFGDKPAGVRERVQVGQVYVDGLGVGDVSQSVMRDRVSIGSDGFFLVVLTIDRQTGQVVAGPDIVTKEIGRASCRVRVELSGVAILRAMTQPVKAKAPAHT